MRKSFMVNLDDVDDDSYDHDDDSLKEPSWIFFRSSLLSLI